MAECKKGLSITLSILTFDNETLSTVAYYFLVGGQLPYFSHFMAIVTVEKMVTAQRDFFLLKDISECIGLRKIRPSRLE